MTDLSTAESIEIVADSELERIEIVEDAPQASVQSQESDPFGLPPVDGPEGGQGAQGIPDWVQDPNAPPSVEATEQAFYAEGAGGAISGFVQEMEAAGVDPQQALAYWQDGAEELGGAGDKVSELLTSRAVPEVQAEFMESLADFGASLRSGQRHEVLDLPDEDRDVLLQGAQQPGSAAHLLHQAWGGDLEANMTYALLALDKDTGVVGLDVQHAIKEMGPEAMAEGLKLAAVMGRRLAHGSVHLQPRRGRKGGTNMATTQMTKEQAEEKIRDLTAEASTALGRGDRVKADKLYKERGRIADALYGNEPIVGSQGRNL